MENEKKNSNVITEETTSLKQSLHKYYNEKYEKRLMAVHVLKISDYIITGDATKSSFYNF